MNQLQSYHVRPAHKVSQWELKGDVNDVAESKLLSQTQDGLDIHYELAVVKGEETFNLVAPWAVRSVCPLCFGGGQTFSRSTQGGIYRSVECPRCGGRGHLEFMREIVIPVTAVMAETGHFRLTGAGLYDSHSLRRGDLYVTLKYVESLPKSH
ncbi:MAG: hypothetical protein LBI10_03865 [Deltaproteobacteria bacterium]|nr:hypothetical protein [Deltaproteobacteria bacterium]